MKTVLCTLYNSLYLDKGLVLYDSLCECAKDFKLYVLCMDDKCYEVLTDLHQEYHIPVKLSDLESDNVELVTAKGNRPIGEYCWTCSSSFIKFVLGNYNEPICTYIDADMYFYHDPQVLVDEMLSARKSVMMVPHRFSQRNEKEAKIVGTYCVEFNTFLNDEAGNKVLNHWHSQCLECCSNIGDGIHWGDQKYMDEWPKLFSQSVHVCNNLGAGIAPWNIDRYKEFDGNNNTLVYNETGESLPIVFYHFQSLVYKTHYLIYTGIPSNLGGIDYGFIDSLYCDYLCKIEKKKCLLKDKYNISTYIRQHPSISENTFRRILTFLPKIYFKIVAFFKKPTYSYSVDIRHRFVDYTK